MTGCAREKSPEEIARFDVNAPVARIDGVKHRHVLMCEETCLVIARVRFF